MIAAHENGSHIPRAVIRRPTPNDQLIAPMRAYIPLCSAESYTLPTQLTSYAAM